MRAETLVNLGLPVKEIVIGDTEVKIYCVKKNHYFTLDKLYAIDKEVWKNFLATERGEVFVEYLDDVSNKMIQISDEFFGLTETDVDVFFRDVYYEETNACEDFLDNKFDERGEEERKFNAENDFRYLNQIGYPLAREYATKLLYIGAAHDSDRMNLLVCYARLTAYLNERYANLFYGNLKQ